MGELAIATILACGFFAAILARVLQQFLQLRSSPSQLCSDDIIVINRYRV